MENKKGIEPTTIELIKKGILKNGVKALNEYGYTTVDTENILTDSVFSGFFRSMLNDTVGCAPNPNIETALTELLAECRR